MTIEAFLEVLDKSEYIHVYSWKGTVYEGYADDFPVGLSGLIVCMIETAYRNYSDIVLKIQVMKTEGKGG